MRLPLSGWHCRVVVESLSGRSTWWKRGPLELWPGQGTGGQDGLLPGIFLFAESGGRRRGLACLAGRRVQRMTQHALARCGLRAGDVLCVLRAPPAPAPQRTAAPGEPSCACLAPPAPPPPNPAGSSKEQWHTALQWATGQWDSPACQQAQQYSVYCQALQALGIVDLNPGPAAGGAQQAGRASRLGGARAALRKAGGWFKGFKAGSQDAAPKAGIRDDEPEEVSTPKMAGAQRMHAAGVQEGAAGGGGGTWQERSMADSLADGRPLLVGGCQGVHRGAW